MSKALLHSLGQSISFGRLPLLGKVLWSMLLAASDDQGRGIAEADVIKWHVCPNVNELTGETIPDALKKMAEQGMLHLYDNGQGQQLYQVVRWWEYQHPKWAWPSKMPAPQGWKDRWCYWNGSKAIFKNWPHSDKPNWWKKLRRKILKRDGGICRYCGAPAKHIDHIIPRSRGGADDPDNLTAACAHCNLTKGARTPEEAGMTLRAGHAVGQS